MKKVIFLMLSLAFVFTACENADVTKAKSLNGTWKGTTMVDEDEADMVCQFFADENSNTGKYIEVINYYDEVEEYDITYGLPYNVYVGGSFSVKDGYLKLTYDTASVTVFADTLAIRDYITTVVEYDLSEEGEHRYAAYDLEQLIKDYTVGTEVELSELWTKVYNGSNNSKGDGFSNLQVNEETMSYNSADLGKIELKRSPKDMFNEYPLKD